LVIDDLRRLYGAHGEKVRYLVVGVFNTAFGYALFIAMLALTRYSLSGLQVAQVAVPGLIVANYFLIAQWTSWVLSVPVGTTTMKVFAFRSQGRLPHEIGRAYLVYLPAVALNSAILWFTVRILDFSPAIGQVFAIGIAVIFSYVGHKYFTFRAQPGT
jgi:putative flippase GtrA